MIWVNVPTHRPRVPNCARAAGSWQIRVMKRELFVPFSKSGEFAAVMSP